MEKSNDPITYNIIIKTNKLINYNYYCSLLVIELFLKTKLSDSLSLVYFLCYAKTINVITNNLKYILFNIRLRKI